MPSLTSFKALGGKLDPSFLSPESDSRDVPNYEATVSKLYTWIESLRADPRSFGIPNERVEDTLKLLTAFFPKPPDDQRIFPVRILSSTGHLGSPRRIEPIEVGFGSGQTTVLITDAPNALGYIFSVASLPVGVSATFEDYFLPLTICYAWSVYLAFLYPVSAPTYTITNVPMEVNLTYLTAPGSVLSPNTVFCLGATWSAADPADAYGAGTRDDDEEEMDRWRGRHLISPALQADPTFLDVPSSPCLHRAAVRRLNEYILGNPNNDPAMTPFLQPLFDGVIPKLPGMSSSPSLSEYIEALSNAAKLETPLPLSTGIGPDFLISHTVLGPKLVKLLSDVVDVIDPDGTGQLKMLAAVQALLEFYLTPHLFDSASQQELPLGPKTKAAVELVANVLPSALTLPLAKKVHSLSCHLQHTHESTDDVVKAVALLYFIYDSKPYGRCSEAFPMYALFDRSDRSHPAYDLRDVRGIKVFPRALGQSIVGGAFKDGFSTENLDASSFTEIDGLQVQDPVVGPPDEVGSALIKLIRQDDNESLKLYSADARRQCPKTFAMFDRLV